MTWVSSHFIIYQITEELCVCVCSFSCLTILPEGVHYVTACDDEYRIHCVPMFVCVRGCGCVCIASVTYVIRSRWKDLMKKCLDLGFSSSAHTHTYTHTHSYISADTSIHYLFFTVVNIWMILVYLCSEWIPGKQKWSYANLQNDSLDLLR